MDFYRDTNKDVMAGILQKLKNDGLEVPDYVLAKTADDKDVETLPPSSFASPGDRSFPLHTKADTWLSAAYFSKNQDTLTKQGKARVKKLIHRGADFWNINRDALAKMDKILGPKLQKTAEEGEELVSTESEFQAYCHNARAKMRDMELGSRRKLSKCLLKLSEDHGWNLDPDTSLFLEKSACEGAGRKDTVTSYIHDLLCDIPKKAKETREVLTTCLKELQETETPLIPSETLFKTASLVDLVFRSRSLHKTSSVLPEQALFDVPPSLIKQAQDEAVQLPGGITLTRPVIQRNMSKLSSDIHTVTGDLPVSEDEIISKLQSMTPVTLDRLLQNMEEN